VPKAKKAPTRKTPTDIHASVGAKTGEAPGNIEEMREQRKSAAAEGADVCPACEAPREMDPKGVHDCARCRKTLLPAVAAKRAAEREETAKA
jgi:hypothetical protein